MVKPKQREKTSWKMSSAEAWVKKQWLRTIQRLETFWINLIIAAKVWIQTLRTCWTWREALPRVLLLCKYKNYKKAASLRCKMSRASRMLQMVARYQHKNTSTIKYLKQTRDWSTDRWWMWLLLINSSNRGGKRHNHFKEMPGSSKWIKQQYLVLEFF